MAEILHLSASARDQILKQPDRRRVGVLAPLDETGAPELDKRWVTPLTERGLDVVIITVGSSYTKEIFPNLDGLLLPGGDTNVHPRCYEERYQRPLYDDDTYDTERDEFAFDLIRQAYDLDLPTLGICRGMQEMVAAFGGALDRLPTDMFDHASGYKKMRRADGTVCLKSMDTLAHHIAIQEGGILHSVLNGAAILRVNSVHKEGVTREMFESPPLKSLKEAFRIEAMAPDNAVEGVSARQKTFFLGLQAHFELPGPMHNRIFSAFKTHIAAYNSVRNGNRISDPELVVA